MITRFSTLSPVLSFDWSASIVLSWFLYIPLKWRLIEHDFVVCFPKGRNRCYATVSIWHWARSKAQRTTSFNVSGFHLLTKPYVAFEAYFHEHCLSNNRLRDLLCADISLAVFTLEDEQIVWHLSVWCEFMPYCCRLVRANRLGKIVFPDGQISDDLFVPFAHQTSCSSETICPSRLFVRPLVWKRPFII